MNRKKTTAFLVAVAVAAALGFIVVMLGGCYDMSQSLACAKACEMTGVKQLDWKSCVCNPQMSTKIEMKTENCK